LFSDPGYPEILLLIRKEDSLRSSYLPGRRQETQQPGTWDDDLRQLALRCLVFSSVLLLCVVAALFFHVESHGVVVTAATVGVLVANWMTSTIEVRMAERLSTRDNSENNNLMLIVGLSLLSGLAFAVVFAYGRLAPGVLGHQVKWREFLLDARTSIAALTALLVSIPPFVRSITNLRKEWKNMRPKTRFEAVTLVAHKRSVVVPMMLGVLLVASGGSILAGRAAVVDTGKAIGNVAMFSVDDSFTPTGKMGDIGDVAVDEQQGLVRFVYQAAGRGPHLWEWKYDSEGKENPQPAQFAGVMYLDPRGNWGSDPEGGYDLRSCHRVIKWEARSIDGPVEVKFVLGGDKRDAATKERGKFPYPNSIDQRLGTKKLDAQWQPFEFDLSNIPDDRFKRVVGGFGWVIAWSSNGVKLNKEQTGADQAKTFTIEIRNVRYER
jgi:hypothetical protein